MVILPQLEKNRGTTSSALGKALYIKHNKHSIKKQANRLKKQITKGA